MYLFMIDKYPNWRPWVMTHKEVCDELNKAMWFRYTIIALLEDIFENIKTRLKNILKK